MSDELREMSDERLREIHDAYRSGNHKTLPHTYEEVAAICDELIERRGRKAEEALAEGRRLYEEYERLYANHGCEADLDCKGCEAAMEYSAWEAETLGAGKETRDE